jgi:hypothetical protein
VKYTSNLLGSIEGKVLLERYTPKMADNFEIILKDVRLFACGPNSAGPG